MLWNLINSDEKGLIIQIIDLQMIGQNHHSLSTPPNSNIINITWQVTWSCKMARKCEVLLRGEFLLFPFKKSVYDVEVTQKWISYENARNDYDEKHYILFGDVTGCRCRKSRTYDVSSCFLTVYHYPICIKSNGGKRSREKQTVTFDIHSSENFEENLRICQRWRNVIMSLSLSAKVHKEGRCSYEW